MKKFLSLLLALLLLFCSLSVFTACSKEKVPELNLFIAGRNLTEADYIVYMDQGYFLGEGVKHDLRAGRGDDSIQIVEYESKRIAKIEYKRLKGEHDARIRYWDKELELKEALFAELKDTLTYIETQEFKKEIESLKTLLKQEKSILFGRDGAYVWFGTQRAIDVTKGEK